MQIFLLICLYITCCIDIDKFPQVFKHADLIPVHKKKEKNDKNSYRAVRILPNPSKTYKKIKCNRLYDYFDKTLFPSQCGFC